MAIHKREGGLSAEETKIVKALLNQGWRNQDIQALINSGGRKATINSARITAVKQNPNAIAASTSEVEFFKRKKKSFDPTTGLNLYEHERLIRAREAMILAVQVFNGPGFVFKTELFAVLSNIAWTYLLHEFFVRKGVKIVEKDGRSIALTQMLKRNDCPLSDGIKRNILAINKIRDEVEHLLLGRSDMKWAPLFQACCLNFDKTLRSLFGEEVSLERELSFALQFAKLDMEQLATAQKYDIPEQIEALDARLRVGLTDDQFSDLEYQFRVVYTLDNATKSKAHIQFLEPNSEQAAAIRNVLLKYKLADEVYPFKPSKVVALVREKSGKNFTSNNHAQAWKLYKARPKGGVKQPSNTNKDYCIYHPTHRDYTYAEKWVNFLIKCVNDDAEFAKIRGIKW